MISLQNSPLKVNESNKVKPHNFHRAVLLQGAGINLEGKNEKIIYISLYAYIIAIYCVKWVKNKKKLNYFISY